MEKIIQNQLTLSLPSNPPINRTSQNVDLFEENKFTLNIRFGFREKRFCFLAPNEESIRNRFRKTYRDIKFLIQCNKEWTAVLEGIYQCFKRNNIDMYIT